MLRRKDAMKVYMIRHGESEGNRDSRHTGQSQVPLTEKGREDACRAGRLLLGLQFDKVYSSDLIRAMETQALALPGAQAERLALLRELDVGSLAGRLVQDCREQLGEAYAICRRDRDFTVFGGESNAMQHERVRQFLSMLETQPEENVAVFCHAGTITCALEVVLGVQNAYASLACENGSVSVFEYKNGSWRVLKWNYTGTL